MQSQVREPIEGKPAAGDDRHLVTRVLAKDRKATAEFVALCADWIYPFVRRRLMPHTGLVEDVAQEILLAAWQNLPTFRGEGGLRGWVLGIARHKIDDHYRRGIRDVPFEEGGDPVNEPVLQPLLEEHLDTEAQRRKIEAVLAALPESYGLALLWRYRDNRSTREMAELTGKTEKAMERLLARAREGFRKRWLDVGR